MLFSISGKRKARALCAKLRRGALNNIANDLGCNLVALGHNRRICEAFFLSLLYESRLSTFGPVTYLSRKGYVIRPLVFLPEKVCVRNSKKANCRNLQTAPCKPNKARR